jgi:peroxiredoxin family protein
VIVVCKEEELDMAVAEAKLIKSPAQAFRSIRDIMQNKMKEQNVTYTDILKSVKKESDGR